MTKPKTIAHQITVGPTESGKSFTKWFWSASSDMSAFDCLTQNELKATQEKPSVNASIDRAK